jgi:hypothetical protein
VWSKPTRSPLDMTLAQADSLPPYYELRGPMLFESGPLRATIDPKLLEYGVLQRADAIVLQMIHDSWPARPIYFARSAVGYPRQLGIESDMLTQGLAWKLFIPPTTAARDTMFVQGDSWLDVARSHDLWTTVFRAPQAVIDEGQWVDRASASMPSMYVFAGAELTEALRLRGQTEPAARVLDTTMRVARAAKLDALLAALSQRATPFRGEQ